jgi:hypothetical protein
VYQGGHVDVYVECPDSAGNRLLVRLVGYDAMRSWPIGAIVGIAVSAGEGIAFAAA